MEKESVSLTVWAGGLQGIQDNIFIVRGRMARGGDSLFVLLRITKPS